MNNFAGDTTTIRIAHIAGLYREQRQHTAMPRSRVLLNAPGNRIMRGHTLEVRVDKLVVSLPSPLHCGDECEVFIAITVEDETFGIVGAAQVISCEGNDNEGYCAKMSFIVSDAKSRFAIEQLFASDTLIQ